MTTRNERAAWILMAAADELRENGWTQFDFVNVEGAHCVLGAINAVADTDINLPVFRPFSAQVAKHGDDRYWARWTLTVALGHTSVSAVATWNDTKDRTQQDAIDLLEYAAGVLLES